MGFDIRRDYHSKSRKEGAMINRKFICCKDGEKEKDKRYMIVDIYKPIKAMNHLWPIT